MFDPDSFMSAQVEGEMSTDFTPIPEGEFTAVISDVKARQAKSSTIMDVSWQIDDAEVAAITGRDTNTVRQSVFLDMTESGGLDFAKGANVSLGRLREALGQNLPGVWSPSMLIGQAARVKVEHRMWEGNTFADVKRVEKLG